MKTLLTILAILLPTLAFGVEAPDREPLAAADSARLQMYVRADSAARRTIITAIDSAFRGTVRPQPRSSTYWVKQLMRNGGLINDPRVEYPRFPRFCLNIYNWADRVFNTYDTTYVVGTGHKWKLQAKSFNWLDGMTMQFPDNRIGMRTHFYSDAGAYLSFMAVSVGYMFNINELMGTPTSRKTFSAAFNCSRFAINLMAQSYTGGMTITHFGHKNDGNTVSIPFNNADVKSLYLDVYYFFNHLRYSHAAAYAFSKYQLRSAGTWMAGTSYSTRDIYFNLSDLNVHNDVQADPSLLRPYHFHYTDYQLLGGYGYNWAIKPHRWVLNATGMLSFGYRRSQEDSTDGKRDMLANGFRVDLAATYNHRALFCSLNALMRGGIFYTGRFIFFNANLQLGLNVGMRF